MSIELSKKHSSKFPCALIGCGVPLLLIAVLVAVVILANKPPQLPKDNAWDDFAQAGDMIRSIGHPGPASSTRPESSWTLLDYEAFVTANKSALDVVRQALQKDYLHPQPKDISYAQVAEHAQFREIARTLLGEAKYRERMEDWGKAADSRLDCLELGVTVPRGGGVMSALVGSVIESIGLSDIHPLLPKLSSDELAHVAERLERIEDKRVPYSETLIEESRVRSPLDLLKDPIYLRRLAREQQGHYQGKSTLKPLSPAANAGAVTRGLCVVTYHEAVLQLLQAEVALRRHKAEHGSYPTSLADLAPKYLKQVPVDPFGQGKPLRYKPLKDGQSFLLYSLGPNLKDDGGTHGKWQGEKTTGDIVAGKW